MATLKEKTQVKRLSKTHHLKNEIRLRKPHKKAREHICVNAAPHTPRSSTAAQGQLGRGSTQITEGRLRHIRNRHAEHVGDIGRTESETLTINYILLMPKKRSVCNLRNSSG